MTPIGSLVPWASMAAGEGSSAELAQGAGDRRHLLVRERARERVAHPVHRFRGPPGDEPDPLAVAVDHHLALPDADVLVRIVEDRGVAPGRALDAVVLAEHDV